MLKIQKIVTPSPEQWMIVTEGARNPMNSWDRIDSYITHIEAPETLETANFEFFLGDNDHSLMQGLAKAGSDHRKFMRMLPVHITLSAPLYWWKEYDTYKVGTVSNSCSTMHKIHSKAFTLDDFSHEHLMDEAFPITDEYVESYMDVLDDVISSLNFARAKYLETKDERYWWQMIQLLPSSYNQMRTVSLNYENLMNIYYARRNHKLDEWHTLCEAIEKLPYFMEIIGEDQ